MICRALHALFTLRVETGSTIIYANFIHKKGTWFTLGTSTQQRAFGAVEVDGARDALVELRIVIMGLRAFRNAAILFQHVGLVAGQTFVAGFAGRTLAITRKAEAILFEVADRTFKYARDAFVTL